MSKSYRYKVVKLLFEKMQQSTDPMVIAALANQLAKYLPKTKQPRRPRGVQAPKEAKEPSLDELVTAMERKRKEARNSLNGGSPEGWLKT